MNLSERTKAWVEVSVVRVSGVPVVSELNIYYKKLCLFEKKKFEKERSLKTWFIWFAKIQLMMKLLLW